jgi:hypothetical protein
MWAYSGVLFALGLASLLPALASSEPNWALFVAFIFGVMASTWALNVVMTRSG